MQAAGSRSRSRVGVGGGVGSQGVGSRVGVAHRNWRLNLQLLQLSLPPSTRSFAPLHFNLLLCFVLLPSFPCCLILPTVMSAP